MFSAVTMEKTNAISIPLDSHGLFDHLTENGRQLVREGMKGLAAGDSRLTAQQKCKNAFLLALRICDY